MSVEDDYLEYGFEFSLAILGVSASYLVDFSNPASFLLLLFVPALYGYTAYISKEGFNHASLTTLTALIFSLVGGVTAVVALASSVGNVAVSVFSGGSKFRDFYSSTSLPLFLTGLILGGSIFMYGAIDQSFKQQTIEKAGSTIGEISQTTFEDSDLLENQRESQLASINRTSKSSVILTTQKVFNETNPSQEVQKSLREAETEVPKQIYSRTISNMDTQEVQISQRISKSIERILSGQKYAAVIPIAALLFFSLQPLIGLLTAILGKIYTKLV